MQEAPMTDSQDKPLIVLSVILAKGPQINSEEPDFCKRPIEDYGTYVVAGDRHGPGTDHNVGLGIVEVPGDFDVSSITQVEVVRPHGSRRNFPGVPSDPTSPHGIRHFINATQILDIASKPGYEGLGITLVSDERTDAQKDAARRYV